MLLTRPHPHAITAIIVAGKEGFHFREICRGLAADYDLKVYPLPFKYRPRSISMIWHERTDQDSFHKCVRELIVGVQVAYWDGGTCA